MALSIRLLASVAILFLAYPLYGTPQSPPTVDIAARDSTTNNWAVSSSINKARLIEVFTSQGCSSCPPADAWLSTQRHSDKLWHEVVPVAYHVTYWDYLGWQDPFARKANDHRQRQQAANANAGFYTPGVFLDRQEWRGWYRNRQQPLQSSDLQVGKLQAMTTGQGIKIIYTPTSSMALENPTVELVFLRSGQQTPVKAGENNGKQLHHDFVAGTVENAMLTWHQDSWIANLDLTTPANASAVALWVTDANDQYLQATGGWVNLPP